MRAGCACADKDVVQALSSRLLGSYSTPLLFEDVRAGKAKQLDAVRHFAINGTSGQVVIDDSFFTKLPGWHDLGTGMDKPAALPVITCSQSPTIACVDPANQNRCKLSLDTVTVGEPLCISRAM